MTFLLSKKFDELNYDKSLPSIFTIIKNILKISIPAALETLFIGIIGLIDTIMVGKISVEALSAVSICQQPVFITLTLSMGINVGITAIISRKKGENNETEARRTLKQAIYIATFCGLAMTILSIVFAKEILELAGAESDTISFGVQYFQTVSSVLVFNYIRLAICAGIRAEGKTRLTLLINVLANIINVFLNYCLIHGNLGFPKLLVFGAALASALANFIAFAICMIIIITRKGFLHLRINEKHIFDKKTVNTLIKFSYPAFIEQCFMRIGFFIISIIVNNLGTYVVAMNAIISGVISLAFNITDGFSIGASALVGNGLGEKKYSLIFAYARLSQVISFILGIIMITLIFIFRIEVCSLFSDDMSVIEGANSTLRFAVFVIFPQSLQWVTTGALRGAGDVKFTSRTSMLSVAIIRPSLSYLLCYPIGLGLLGSWIGMFADQTIRFTINNWRLNSLKWMKIKV